MKYAYGIVNCFCKQLKSTHRRCSVRKGVLRNFAKFTGKYLLAEKTPSQMFDSVLNTPLELLTIFAKSSILNVQLRSEHAYGTVNCFCKRLKSTHQRCSCKNHRKTLVSESIFNKVAGLAQVFSCEYCEISKNTFSQNNSGRLLWKTSSQIFDWVLDRPLTF